MILSERKRAVIYCRVSSSKQVREGHGLKSQETRCREFAQFRDYDVLEVFCDDITGGTAQRRGMTEMLGLLRKHRRQGIIVIIDDLSRLARHREAYWELRKTIDLAGGILESPSIKFGSDADSVFFEGLMVTVAQHQKEKNGEQTKNRMRARVMSGYWVFQAPTGYRFAQVTGQGKMLKRDEPVASVVQEALEGYASGRFETQAEVMRFLQDNPLFPKDKSGIVRNQRVAILLKQCAYAGLIEAPTWGVGLRRGLHEPLISTEVYQRIQDRLNGIERSPRRKNLNVDFPLRGFVLCSDCETPLTACWSTGTHSRHPYYLCPKRGCASYGKSIRRDKLEGEFEELLKTVKPSDGLYRVARAMFSDLWARRYDQGASQTKALAIQLEKVERQVSQLLERILSASVPIVITAYEERVRKLEEEKLVLQDRIAQGARPAASFDETLRTALDFLGNPWNLWRSGRLEDKRTVLKLAFVERLRYSRNEGLRTANLSLPFKVMDQINGVKKGMVRSRDTR